MKSVVTVVSLFSVSHSYWYADWAWGVLLIVMTLVIHVIGLLLIDARVERVHNRLRRFSNRIVFVAIIGVMSLLATVLHGTEGIIWAAAYRLLGALTDYHEAVLYSLSAITSYGHASVVLEKHWQLMGALEALNGWLLFGLTTAFMFGVFQRTLMQHKHEHA